MTPLLKIQEILHLHFTHTVQRMTGEAQQMHPSSSHISHTCQMTFERRCQLLTWWLEWICQKLPPSRQTPRTHPPLPLQSVVSSESPLQPTSNSDVDGGSDYEPSTYKPLSKSSTPVPGDHHPLPRLSSSKEELYIGVPPTFQRLAQNP